MSVLMVLKIPVEAGAMERAAGEHGELIRGIAGRAKERGAIHHDFYEGDGEVIVVDEWDSEDSFNAFYEAEGQNIGQLMGAAGAQGAPAPPTFHRKMSLGDEF
jgi:heme-degrading monooxygenase HmoA